MQGEPKMPFPTQAGDQWWVNDQTPDNPYGKSEDYEAFLAGSPLPGREAG